MNIPFLDISTEFDQIHQQWFNDIKQIASAGHYILGHHVHAFEQEAADYLGSQHGVSVANGTDALTLSLRGLGIGPGDEVITSPFMFISAAEAICHVGATPVFADIDANSLNITAESIASVISDNTRAIIVVHLFGKAADMPAIMQLANQYNLRVIEDAAQAFGASIDGQKVGSFGDAGCFSFYPTKILGCYGDGGMISTSSPGLLERLHSLRNHGAIRPFVHHEVGYNSRLDEIQAALLRIKLKTIDDDIKCRQNIAEQYTEQLKDCGVTLPDATNHVFNLYTIRIKKARDNVKQFLSDNNIPTSQCYPQVLSTQPVFEHLNYQEKDVPVATQATHETLSLPVYPALQADHVSQICDTLKRALQTV